jgi:hypothetical protein
VYRIQLRQALFLFVYRFSYFDLADFSEKIPCDFLDTYGAISLTRKNPVDLENGHKFCGTLWMPGGHNSNLWTYDFTAPICNVLEAGKSIIRASGRGLALEIETFLGSVKWHRAARKASAIWEPKKSRFPGPIPLPLVLVMDLPASKALRTRAVKS